MFKENKTVVLVAGGTGGHVMPALATGQDLDHKGYHSLYIIDERVQNLFNQETCFVLPIKRPHLKSMTFWYSFLKSFMRVLLYLKRIKPLYVIAFGGYCCLPTMLAAIILRIPLYLHEQNAILGQSHRLFLPFAKKLFLSFETTLNIPERFKKKCHVTGMPVRCSFYAPQKPFCSSDFTLLILGGSQGASVFSHVIPQSLKLLPPLLQSKCHVYQQCREEMLDETRSSYTTHHFSGQVTLQPFFDNIIDYMEKAHLIISRAGASTLAELALLGKKALFIPLSTAIYDHQTLNAQAQCDKDGGWIMNEATLTPQALATFIEKYYHDFKALKYMNKKNNRQSPISLLNFI